MSDVAITIDHVSKLFRKQKQQTFKEMLPALFGGQGIADTFLALRDINLEVRRGETLGVIGPNGSGKSTLLKLVAGVTQPSMGKVTVNGRLAPLIELGAGFHPELTGRENVYLNGVILGMSRKETESKFNEIVEFSELKDHIDRPVKYFSSGMYLRLAFSVAVSINPEILLVDEILAVGDESFQKKCLKKMREFVDNGSTLIIVSHNLNTIAEFCDRGVLLKFGDIVFDGAASKAVSHYKSSL